MKKLNFKALMELYGYSISSLAKETGLSYMQVYRIVNGVTLPRLDDIKKFKSVFKCDYGTICIALEKGLDE